MPENRPQHMRWFVLLTPVMFLIAGCAPIEAPTPTIEEATFTPLPSLTPSPTIDWFPATPTPTRLPTPVFSPTPNTRPGIGELIYEDDFSDEAMWLRYEAAVGNVSINNNHITLALNEAEGLIFGIRHTPLITNYYAEITASPNFCEGANEYGLMLRVYGEEINHYRLSISCDGRARVTRIFNRRALTVIDWFSHPVLPTTYPNSFRLGAWVKDKEIRFFINDFELFSVENAVIVEGAIGVFLRVREQESVSVNFSDLKVYQLVDLD